jgi:hypothetical protein
MELLTQATSAMPAASEKRPGSGEGRPLDSRGLTLIETIFALGIMSFWLLGMFVPLQYALSSMASSTSMAAAIEVATSRMEEIKIDPVRFFSSTYSIPTEEQPPPWLEEVWHHENLSWEFGQVPGYPNMACHVILDSNVGVNNTGVVRIPCVWIRPGGRQSTLDGQPFDPDEPDAHPALVELRSVVVYR